MNIDFPLILTVAVLLSGFISLLDILFFSKRRLAKGQVKPGKIVEYSRSFFPVLLLVLVIRSFIVQPFRVPTGSLEPTIAPGDFIAVNQFAYGLRLPVTNTKIVNIGEPKTGQVAVFRWPQDTSIDFVKRVIGVPGDHIEYKNKVLYVNGKQATQTYIGPAIDSEPEGDIPVQQYTEDLNGVKHLININPNAPTIDFDITVPAGEYFMMGDNRDDSADSRMWGYVPEANLIGKGFIVWMNWNSQTHRVNWQRIGTVL